MPKRIRMEPKEGIITLRVCAFFLFPIILIKKIYDKISWSGQRPGR